MLSTFASVNDAQPGVQELGQTLEAREQLAIGAYERALGLIQEQRTDAAQVGRSAPLFVWLRTGVAATQDQGCWCMVLRGCAILCEEHTGLCSCVSS